MWSLINIKETVNMQMWYLVIYFKIAGVLKTNIFGEYGLDVFFFFSQIYCDKTNSLYVQAYLTIKIFLILMTKSFGMPALHVTKK